MLTIRLHRTGKTNQPTFKIVVVDKRTSAAAGRFCEEIGSLNRVAKTAALNKERALYWLSKGAQPSASVHNLFVSQKIVAAKKLANHAQPKKAAEASGAAQPAKQ